MDDKKEKRPKKSPKEKGPSHRLSPIPFRVTEHERQQISDAAARAGLTTSAYIRTRVLDEKPSMRATKKPSIEAEGLAQLLGYTGKIATNLQNLTDPKMGGVIPRGTAEAITETRNAAAAIIAALTPKKTAQK